MVLFFAFSAISILCCYEVTTALKWIKHNLFSQRVTPTILLSSNIDCSTRLSQRNSTILDENLKNEAIISIDSSLHNVKFNIYHNNQLESNFGSMIAALDDQRNVISITCEGKPYFFERIPFLYLVLEIIFYHMSLSQASTDAVLSMLPSSIPVHNVDKYQHMLPQIYCGDGNNRRQLLSKLDFIDSSYGVELEKLDKKSSSGDHELIEWLDENHRILAILPRKIVHNHNLLHRGIGKSNSSLGNRSI